MIEFPSRSPQQIIGLANGLWEERRICIKFRPQVWAVRVATAPFYTAEEVDWLLEALAQLVSEM